MNALIHCSGCGRKDATPAHRFGADHCTGCERRWAREPAYAEHVDSDDDCDDGVARDAAGRL